MIGLLGALWGLGGVFLLLGYAIVRLAPLAIEAFSVNLRWYHWLILGTHVLLMAYLEGYRGFQKGFSPRVAARAKYLNNSSQPIHALLGPFFCMGYYHTSRRTKITTISLTTGIIILVGLIRFLDQPWRGIVDTGIIVGLSWGIISLLIFSIRAFTSDDFDHSPQVPEG